MTGTFTRLLNSRGSKWGIILGAAYGLIARIVVSFNLSNGRWFGVMTIAFLAIVPIAIGVITVTYAENPSLKYRIFGPWVPMFFTLCGTAALNLEGAICIYLAIPVVFPLASLGGLLGVMVNVRKPALTGFVLALPFVTSPLEMRIGNPPKLVETVQEVEIAAPPSVVWPLVVSVDSIRPGEQERALFMTLGFPRPVSANLDHAGVGGVRRAKFERGLIFTETVTDWIPQQKLSFTIEPNTDAIPASTLDEHVTIGGPYFDVLTGTYELIPLDNGTRTRLVLHSTHRVSTHFNIYAGWWAGRIMSSIQANVLDVLKKRAEHSASQVRSSA